MPLELVRVVAKKTRTPELEVAEGDPRVRATLVLALDWGATAEEATALLRGIDEKYKDYETPSRLDKRLRAFSDKKGVTSKEKDGTRRAARYVEVLREIPVAPGVLRAEGERVRRYLLSSERARTFVWRTFPDTRAIVVNGLRSGRTPGVIAEALSRYLRLDRVLEKSTIEGAIRRDGEEGLINRLVQGFLPSNLPIDEKYVTSMSPTADALFDAVETSHYEKSWYWHDPRARALVVLLLDDDHVPGWAIAWALQHEFKKETDYQALYRMIRRRLPDREDATFSERRKALAEEKGTGISSELLEEMNKRAEAVKAAFFLNIQETEKLKKNKKQQAPLIARRNEELPERTAFVLFRDVLDAVRGRQHNLPKSQSHIPDIDLIYTQTPRANRPVQTLIIDVWGSGEELDTLTEHMRNELEETAAGLDTELRSALGHQQESNAFPIERVILSRGPKESVKPRSFDIPK